MPKLMPSAMIIRANANGVPTVVRDGVNAQQQQEITDPLTHVNPLMVLRQDIDSLGFPLSSEIFFCRSLRCFSPLSHRYIIESTLVLPSVV
ncbi:hypothetical protein PR003_g23774 [Phytophthora rubi]|uniref:Uncharacterized protein n=1 Tax=Phytophthora rubi TaxID=129364 RepID=A0A6A4CWS2_9STRA|nr:hypothetical protein PR003_g23774 [Phytophthora rubi]